MLTAGDVCAGLLEALAGRHHRNGGREHSIAHDHADPRHDQDAQDALNVPALHEHAHWRRSALAEGYNRSAPCIEAVLYG